MSKTKKIRKKKKGILHTAGRLIVLLTVLTVLLLLAIFYFRYGKDVVTMEQEAKLIVKLSTKDSFRGAETSLIYDADGNEIKSLSGEKDVYYVNYENIPTHIINAMVAVEDRKFFDHKGIDAEGIARAFVALIKHDGKITQGGSTITQQLAKNIFLSNEVTWRRKVKEAFVAVNLEKKYTKDQIMEFYLNNIYFGHGYYGVDAAAKGFFQQELLDLSLSQIAFLCAIPNNPTYYNPVENMDNTLERRDKILGDMLEMGFINELDYTRAIEETITLNVKSEQHNNYVETYIFNEATRALMQERGFRFMYSFATDYEKEEYQTTYSTMYAECQQSLYTGGYRIYTSMNLEIQEELQKAVDEVLSDYQETNEEGVYALQSAAACFDNENGYICAIVGGRTQDNIEGYTLNRAYQSPRQPGSAIKPLNVYLPAFEAGYRPEDVINVVDDEGDIINTMTLFDAIKRSSNSVATQLYRELKPARGMTYISNMEFKYIVSQDKDVLAGALGGFTYGVTAEEMVAAYGAIANQGKYTAPTCIQKITDVNGEIIFEHESETKQIYDQNATEMMTAALENVLKDGGTAEGYGLENMHAAGKTGTTNKNYDGWFCGYTPYYTTAVWVGYDMPRELKELAGNTYPVRVWNQFMTWLHKGLEDKTFPEYYVPETTTEEEVTTEAPTTAATEENDTTEEVTEQEDTTEEDTEEPTTEAENEGLDTTEEIFEDEPEEVYMD